MFPWLDFFDDGGFELHWPEPVDFAVDVVTVGAVYEANVAHFGAGFDGVGAAFNFEAFDDRHGIAVSEDVADGVLDDRCWWLVVVRLGDGGPLMPAF